MLTGVPLLSSLFPQSRWNHGRTLYLTTVGQFKLSYVLLALQGQLHSHGMESHGRSIQLSYVRLRPIGATGIVTQPWNQTMPTNGISKVLKYAQTAEHPHYHALIADQGWLRRSLS